MTIRICALVCLSVLSLSGCAKKLEAPMTAGVCWRLAPAMNGTEDFKPFASGVENLESCAAKLEGVHLALNKPIVGGFQGRIIYVDVEDITVAANGKTQRYRVFTPGQRSQIDAGLQTLKDRQRDGG